METSHRAAHPRAQMTRLLLASLAGMTLILPPIAAQASRVVHYVRYEPAAGGEARYGILEGENVQELAGDLFSSPQPTGRTTPRAQVRLLAPVAPSKVLAVGLNYKSHLGEGQAPSEPAIFLKSPTSIVGPGEAIELPEGASAVHYESELVLVIGKRAKNVSAAEAHEVIFGVTCGNDVSARAWQRSDLQWFRAKAADTFGPIGPVIATGLDISNLKLRGRLNGETVQEESTGDLLFGPAEIVSFISRYVTLLPGDVIFTGTPGRTRALDPGDVFEVEIEGIGTLTSPVVAASRD